MNSSLENFHPKLRVGRVIPRGSHIIFETDDPYNQIVLPMALADLVLLCSGQFSVRDIVEKIYIKQGTVPFKLILKALHQLHQGGFFANGSDLVLNSYLQSWMEPRRNRWVVSWRLVSRVKTDRVSATTYYIFTLMTLVTAILGLQHVPSSPLRLTQTWLARGGVLSALAHLFICGSVVQTVRYFFRIIQSLLLTGKAYNISLRLSPWGLYLHLGDEANGLFEGRLFSAMFYLSQILIVWSLAYFAQPYLTASWLEPLLIACVASTFWEVNPFVMNDGLKLLRFFLLSRDGEIASWHFENSSLIRSLITGSRRDAEFARICIVWGSLWLVGATLLLQGAVQVFGPAMLGQLTHFSWDTGLAVMGVMVWLSALFYIVQVLVETLAVSLLLPWTRTARRYLNRFRGIDGVSFRAQNIVTLIQDLPLFSHFHEQMLTRIVERSQVMEFGPGSFIIQQGQTSHTIFVLLVGEVEVIRAASGLREWIVSLGPVSIFGEAALLDDSPRAAQVMAKSASQVLCVPVGVIREMAKESQTVRHLENFRNAILVNQFFASSPVFRSLSQESIEFLCSRGTVEYFDANTRVFAQGESGDSIYMILRGSVGVEAHGALAKRISQGNFFGEIALIANIPRTGTIVTVESCVLFKISAQAFWEVLVAHMDLGVFIETVSEMRLRDDLEVTSVLKPTGSGSSG